MKATGRDALALSALGVVFGDIGTSPLYAFQTVFAAPHDIEVTDCASMAHSPSSSGPSP